jgi:hypothetical protein
VALNKHEYQDVAVITVENLRNGAVQLQIVGDEALYGPNYIVEPNYDETPNPGYMGNNYKRHSNKKVKVVTTTYYEVASWPILVYINRPGYVVWRSPWSWGYYPDYWRPWTPYYWHYYYGYHYNWFGHYYVYYRPFDHIRCRNYRVNYYTNIRNTSPTVIVNINKGDYKNTYSRPELRSEGERLYSHRASMSGNNIPPQRASRSDEKTPRPVSIGSERGVREHEVRRDPGAATGRPMRQAERMPRASESALSKEDAGSRPTRASGESRPNVLQEPAIRSGREAGSTSPMRRRDIEVRRSEPSPKERSQQGSVSRPAMEGRSKTEYRMNENVKEERSRPADRNQGAVSLPERNMQQSAPRTNDTSRPTRSKESRSQGSTISKSERQRN